ncbi:unnamed protein product [Aphis gossypii]|uniref:Carboxylesterase type B domain-containing protein n=1 Tax=Aphis gossypii TaxID=80765 RepID=A0A9P0NGZ8_APHGO|nr:unnamed protein product [Aphis gossypii]
MQSGCAFNPWALNENHRATAFKLANKLGCFSNDPKEIVKCLKNVSAIDLVKETESKDETNFMHYKFVPSIESDVISNPFLPAHPRTLAISTIPIPVIIGLTDMEGIVALTEERLSEFSDVRMADEISKLLKNRYSTETISKIKDFYFNKSNISSETMKLENICNFHGDFLVFNDFYDAFDCFLKQNITPIYKYEFKFDGEINDAKNMIFATRPGLRHTIKGACHADEMYYLFRGNLSGLPKPNSPEHEMCKMMSKMWTNFAKTGDPNSPDLSFKWINTTASDLKYLSIDRNRTRMIQGMINNNRFRFWKELSESIV